MPSMDITLGGVGHESIHLDGVDISKSVCGLTLDAKAGHLPQVTLRLPVTDRTTLGVPARAGVVIDDDTHALLVRLGWTPPKTAA